MCLLKYCLSLLMLLLTSPAFASSAQQDLKDFRQHYQQLFPQLSLQDYADGIYAIDPISRESWLAINEFPPYETGLDEGRILFHQAFKDGHHYADCFANQGIGIAHLYPVWDSQKAQVVTLARAINNCRIKHQEAPLPYKKGALVKILAFMAYTSRGKTIRINIPDNDPRAQAAYQQGKDYYYQRRGQLNFSCASCHVQNAGKYIRSEMLSPSLGHTSHWPTYRLKWGELGSLHRRFIGCHQQIRAPAPKAQSTGLSNLEYFLTYMANGIKLNGPGTRK